MTLSSACAVDRHTGLQARDDLEGADGAQRGDVRELARQRPDLGWPRELYIVSDYADDGVRLAVQPHETTDNRGSLLNRAPHGFAEQHDARRWALVFGFERAAHNRDHPRTSKKLALVL